MPSPASRERGASGVGPRAPAPQAQVCTEHRSCVSASLLAVPSLRDRQQSSPGIQEFRLVLPPTGRPYHLLGVTPEFTAQPIPSGRSASLPPTQAHPNSILHYFPKESSQHKSTCLFVCLPASPSLCLSQFLNFHLFLAVSLSPCGLKSTRLRPVMPLAHGLSPAPRWLRTTSPSMHCSPRCQKNAAVCHWLSGNYSFPNIKVLLGLQALPRGQSLPWP